MASRSKKRKIEDENRFNEEWTEAYFMVAVPSGKGMVCVVCNELIKTLKKTMLSSIMIENMVTWIKLLLIGEHQNSQHY